MGNCSVQNKRAEIDVEKRDDDDLPRWIPPAENKILLLGARDTGKSTFFKQIVYKYHQPMDKHHKSAYFINTISRTVMSLQDLIVCVKANRPLEEDLPLLNQAIAELGSDIDLLEHPELKPSVVLLLQQIWRLPSIQMAYTYRVPMRLHLSSHLPYFMENLERINKADYEPSLEEVVKIKAFTLGVYEREFLFNGVKHRLFDVGGQRDARKKWIDLFEDVSCLVYFAALGSFDEVLYEDDVTMRLQEDLTLWEELTDLCFPSTPKILVFTKMDIFDQKHPSVPFTSLQNIITSLPTALVQVIHDYLSPTPDLSICFSDYHHQKNNDAIAFTKQKFLAVAQDPSSVEIFPLTTTNTEQCVELMKLIHNTIVRAHHHPHHPDFHP